MHNPGEPNSELGAVYGNWTNDQNPIIIMIIFIELWKAKSTWIELNPDERAEYLSHMKPCIPIFIEKGGQIISWGKITGQISHNMDYEYFAIWAFPNDKVANDFQQLLHQARWYDYFEQVNINGQNKSPDVIMEDMIQS